MTQSDFILLAQKLASELLDMRDETSEDCEDEIARGDEPSYFLCGRVDKKDLNAILAYVPTADSNTEDPSDSPDLDEAYRAAATQQWHREGEIEIDSNAVVSKGDDPGAYVAAWVWVPDSGIDTTATEEKDN